MRFNRDKSDCTCSITDIQSFTFGGFSSRFWLLRKHINSMEHQKLLDLPFYCWECITISTKERDIDLIIKNQKDMQTLLEFLIISIKTCDGRRGSATEWLKSINKYEKPENSIFGKLKSFLCTSPNDLKFISEDVSSPQE